MKSSVLAVLAVAVLAGPAHGQSDRTAPHGQGQATIYRDPNFQGPAVSVEQPRPDLELAWPARSIRVRSGVWELCSQPSYQGRCTRVAATESDLRAAGFSGRLASMRPLGGPETPVGGSPPSGPDAHDPGLRGMAAEFRPTPIRGGRRVLACPHGPATAGCASQSADRYCRSIGWNRAAHQALRTERGQVNLVDVLCVR